MPVVNFINEKKQIQVPEGTNLRTAAFNAGVQVYKGIHKVLHCPGLGQCGSCRVLIKKGMDHASQKGFIERTRLGFSMAYIGHEDEMRLACQTNVMGDMDVVTQPDLNLFGDNFFS